MIISQNILCVTTDSHFDFKTDNTEEDFNKSTVPRINNFLLLIVKNISERSKASQKIIYNVFF